MPGFAFVAGSNMFYTFSTETVHWERVGTIKMHSKDSVWTGKIIIVLFLNVRVVSAYHSLVMPGFILTMLDLK